MSLEDELTAALRGTIDAARNHNYVPTYFLRMLDKYGGLGTAKRLLVKNDRQTRLFKLYELGLLDESMEAVVLQERFRPLFTDEELAEARRRLEELGYSQD